MRTRSRISLISGRFHWWPSNRPTLPRPQFRMSQTWFAVYPDAPLSSASRRDRRRFATVAPYASSLIDIPLRPRRIDLRYESSRALSVFERLNRYNTRTGPVDVVMSLLTLRFTNQGFSDAMSEVFRMLSGTKGQPEALWRAAENPADLSCSTG